MSKKNFDLSTFLKGVLVGTLLVALVVFCFLYGGRYARLHQEAQVLNDPLIREKLGLLENLVDKYYLYEKEEEDLAEGMYMGLIYGLNDPYSCYYTPDAYATEAALSEGSYVGIGVTLQPDKEGRLLIRDVYTGGPADQAGIQPGDEILEVDGRSVEGVDYLEVVKNIRAAKEKVVLEILREEKSFPVTLLIGTVEVDSATGSLLEGKVGYVRILEFNENTPEQYEALIETLSQQGMEKLVVDLRGNPGGLVTSVCDVLRQILPEGLIVYTQNKEGEQTSFHCDGSHRLSIPLAVLVDGGSASAAEIFAGAVKDYGIGVLFGTQTYGKGVVQGIYTLPDGSALRLTISEYYTPKGNSIHKVGITPDQVVEVREGDEKGTPGKDAVLDAALKWLG